MSKARTNRGRHRDSFAKRVDELPKAKFQMPGKMYEKLGPCIIIPGTSHHVAGRPMMWNHELQKLVLLARWVYMVAHGLTLAFLKNAGNMVVAHMCDNGRCININHLELIPRGKNIEHAIARQRLNYVFYKNQWTWIMKQAYLYNKSVEAIFQASSWHTLFAKRGMYRRGTLHQPGFKTFQKCVSGEIQGWNASGARAEFFKKYAKRIPGGDPYQ